MSPDPEAEGEERPSYMVRVSDITDQASMGINEISWNGITASKQAFDLADEGLKSQIHSGIADVSALPDAAEAYVQTINRDFLEHAEEAAAHRDAAVNDELAILGVGIPLAIGAATVAGSALAGSSATSAAAATGSATAAAGGGATAAVGAAGGATAAASGAAAATGAGLASTAGHFLSQAALMAVAAYVIYEVVTRVVPALAEKITGEMTKAAEAVGRVEELTGLG